MPYLLTLFLLCTPIIESPSSNPSFPRFDSNTIVKYQGKVLSIQKLSFANRPAPHIQIILRTGRGDIPVELGPEWYLKAKGIIFSPMDEIEVVGSVIQVEDKPLMLAISVRKADNEFKFRDQSGRPLWNKRSKELPILYFSIPSI